MSASAANLTGRGDVQEVLCRVMRLDDFTKAEGVRPDFVKCDVEGAELLVYQGAIETLKRDRPVLFTEMLRKWSEKFNYHPNDIIDLLAGIGYRCFTARAGKLVPFGRMDETTVETNFFFLDPVRHAAKITRARRGGGEQP